MKKLQFLAPLVRLQRCYSTKKPVILTADEAVKVVKSGDICISHVVAGQPQHLIKALEKRHNELRDVTFYSEHMIGNYPIYNPAYSKSFKTRSFFFGASERKTYKEQKDAYGETNIDYIPINLNETMRIIRSLDRVDVAMISISPPDKHGFTSLGVNVNFMPAVLESMKILCFLTPV
jgi:4-hydroxybutyrate CoA-transferase